MVGGKNTENRDSKDKPVFPYLLFSKYFLVNPSSGNCFKDLWKLTLFVPWTLIILLRIQECLKTALI